MKHASPKTIHSLFPLLEQIREIPGLKEKKQGIFYRKSKAFLHFHEDGSQIYADVRLGGEDFERFSSTTQNEQNVLLNRIREFLQSTSA
ncbi:MAG: hypothetical protein WBA57_22285 [Elainellaceae cyanobacterium]